MSSYPRIRNAILTTLFGLVLTLLSALPLFLWRTQFEASGQTVNYLSFVSILIYGGLAFYGFKRAKIRVSDLLQWNGHWVWTWIGIILLTLPLHIVALFLGMSVFSKSEFSQNMVKGMESSLGSSPTISLLLLAVVFAPIAEEMFFRGFLFHGLSRQRSVWSAGLCSVLLFSVVHINPSQMVGTLLLGSFTCVVLYKTGNIVLTISAHAFYNMWLFLLPWILGMIKVREIFPTLPIGEFYTFDLIDVLGLVALLVGIPLFVKFAKANRIRSEDANSESIFHSH